MTSGRVAIVGLGPAGIDHLLPTARTAVERAPRRYVRTARHPAVEQLAAAGIAFESFDPVYDRASDLDAAYAEIVRSVIAAANTSGNDEIVYAVPGNPAVAERTVVLLHEAATR